jgi:phosphoribosyl 1,2-cyclic phosphodiesterase
VVTAAGTWERLAPTMGAATFRSIGLPAPLELGPFRIAACPTSHDAADPLALTVRTSDGTGLGVAYDLGRPTAAVRYLLRDLTALVLEANYDEIALRTSGYPPVVQRRIAGSGGHLSNRAAAELLAELHHPGLSVVVLAHLSQRCNTADDARATVAPALRRVGFSGTLHVAAQDQPLPAIDLSCPGRVQLQLAL